MKTKNLTQLVHECNQLSELTVKLNESYLARYETKSTGLVQVGGHLYVAGKVFEKLAGIIGWGLSSPLVGVKDFPVNDKKTIMSMSERVTYLIENIMAFRKSSIELCNVDAMTKLSGDKEKLEMAYSLIMEAMSNLMRASFYLDEVLFFVENKQIIKFAEKAGLAVNEKSEEDGTK